MSWCPKYRRPVLTGDVSDRLVEMLQVLVSDIGGTLVNLDVRPHHFHLFGGFPPTISPQLIVHLPEAPFCPQLPGISPKEQMKIQYSEGMPRVVVDSKVARRPPAGPIPARSRRHEL